MTRDVQVTFDAADPRRLGAFWAEVLGYVTTPPPVPHETWEAALAAWGVPPERWDDAWAIVDPEGSGPRIYFQRVPEGTQGKNRRPGAPAPRTAARGRPRRAGRPRGERVLPGLDQAAGHQAQASGDGPSSSSSSCIFL